MICGKTEIRISGIPPQDSCEMELGRFRLQEGARLRYIYQNLQDYDTINRMHAPYACMGGSTVSPEILVRFAEEMMEMEVSEPFDIAVVMNILANDGRVSRNAITGYFKIKNKRHPVPDNNQRVYQELLRLIAVKKKYNSASREHGQKGKQIMLV